VNGEHVLVVGGADHGTGASDGADDGPYRDVVEYTRERFPGAEALYRWSAQVFAPADGLPYVGPAPLRDDVYLAAGFDGDGLLWGTVAGRVLADVVRDVESPYAQLLRPARIKPVAAGAAFLKENINSAVRWVSDRFARDVADAGELSPGEGGLAFHRGERLALYRDDAGVLHACDAVCPHLGCIVRWNGADRTWDCPCHGSRFSATGGFLAGPATRPLERREVE
jgi:Rieske Fe-S protein